ncbi:universal stress protein [Natrarchaeobius oligotrophus]|uniref:Universal stress protein n=1 Tax=Natrarchaeobius chitinivorans TaxID=1679083 RepID=A0A3N6MF81_NATCH|nr:universal stress protein [Natrarchaeobius chitinivorans]RQH02684.1 universal stress protein [Natrarchaeobius chitinivorans]
MPRHVLVSIDDSERSFAALEYALASFPNASLTALTVVDPRADRASSPDEREGPTETDVLDRAVERAEDHGLDLRTERRTGTPRGEILSAAVGLDVDHLVLGSHGQSPVSRPFLGRVSEAVLRRSAVSTTIVPEPASAVRDRELPGRVLIAVDGSEQSDAALEYALETLGGGTHTALHVISLPFDRSHVDVSGTYLDKILTAHEASADVVLESAREMADGRGIDLETERAYGSPAAEIVEYAETNGFDQIVMGSHGRSLAARMVTGTEAERVARRTTRSVTLVRGRA